MVSDYIFVYGSLRSEFDSPVKSVLQDHAKLIGKATFQGKLYMIEWYPGVIESDDSSDRVIGEIYKIKNQEVLLSQLDQYEGCSPNDPEPHAFIRRVKSVLLESGGEIRAWIYLYNESVKNKQCITSGNYSKDNG